MEFFEMFGTSEPSVEHNTQMPIGPSEYIPDSGAVGFQTTGLGGSTLYSNYPPRAFANNSSGSVAHATNSFPNQSSSISSFRLPSPSRPFEIYPPPPHDPQFHLPSFDMTPTYSHYYQPGPQYQYPAQNPFPGPHIPFNYPLDARQSSAGFSTSPPLFGGQNDPRETAHHRHFVDQYSTPSSHSSMPQHLMNDPAVRPGSHLPPHNTASVFPINSRQVPAHQLPTQRIRQRSQQRGGLFYGAHNFVIGPHAVITDINSTDNFMPELLKQTIPGAAFDSSSRNSPPRCYPGTRLVIIDRVQRFITNRNTNKKMLWIVGPAGVGKSAIMQSVSESTPIGDVALGASIFFSVNGRNDGTKAIATLAYQLATRYAPYRQFIQDEMANDPSLPQKSMAAQFNKFIVEPFVHRLRNHKRGRFVIIIDGLDECSGHDVQCKLLGLISYCCLMYPTSPLVWLIASRPEPHITAFLSRTKVAPAYDKEEISVDSYEACQDVERFLRFELKKIQTKSLALRDIPRWPAEYDLLEIAGASRGLFAYASAVAKFIDDPAYGDPASQLDEFLEVINSRLQRSVEGKPHPMAPLDALYSQILSRIPAGVMVKARKVLFMLIDQSWNPDECYQYDVTVRFLCNWAGMTKNDFYGATYHLRSVLDIPEPDKAMFYELESFHNSFIDYLVDVDRSHFCPDIRSAVRQFSASCVRRILEEAPNGTLKNGPGTYTNISLSWPSQLEERSDLEDGTMMTNDEIMFGMYYLAAVKTFVGFANKQAEFRDPYYIHALTAFHEEPGGLILQVEGEGDASIFEFREHLFHESRRSELTEHGVLKQIPLGLLDFCNIFPTGAWKEISYWFKCPVTTMTEVPNHWSSCVHGRHGNYEEGQDQDWTTRLLYPDPWCRNCVERFLNHLENGKLKSPDDPVTVFIDLHLFGFVEYRYVDPEDGVSEWTYIFSYRFPSLTGM